MASFKRRRLLVDRRLQGSIISHALTAVVFVLLVGIAGSIVPLVWQLSSGRSADHESAGIIMLYLHERLWPLALFGLLVVAGSALHFSHRIAGPLVRVRRHLRQLGDGEIPPPLRTRPRDFLKVEVECLNFAASGIAHRIETIGRGHRAVERAFAELGTTPGPAAEAALARAIDELGAAIAELRLPAAGAASDEQPQGDRLLALDDAMS